MLKEYLVQVGLNENESTVYLELLKLGSQAVSTIAKKVELNRTTTYSILKSLECKGLVSSYMNGNVKFFSANDPNALVGYVDRKCRMYDYFRTQMLSMIPEFRGLVDMYDFKKPVVRYYDGVEGVKQVMFDTLRAKGVFRAYLALNRWFDSEMKDFLIEYRHFRIKDRKVPLKAIVPDTKEVRAFFQKNNGEKDKMSEYLFVNGKKSESLFQNEMNIYNDKVAIIHLDKGAEFAVVIESEQIAEMHKTIFDMAWKGFGG